MIQIHICEDSEEQLKQICKAIKNACAIVSEEMSIVTTTTKPETLLEVVGKNSEVNVYFLDIDLRHKTMNGFNVAMKIREKEPFAYICFVTTHSEMSYLTFKYKIMAFDFIIKDTYEHMSRDFLGCIRAIDKQVNLVQSDEEKYLELELFHERKMVPIKSIMAIEIIGNHKTRMYTDTQTIDMSRTLSSIKKELPTYFVKCHRGAIINAKEVSSFNSADGQLVLSNGMEFYVATRKIREMVNFMKQMK